MLSDTALTLSLTFIYGVDSESADVNLIFLRCSTTFLFNDTLLNWKVDFKDVTLVEVSPVLSWNELSEAYFFRPKSSIVI